MRTIKYEEIRILHIIPAEKFPFGLRLSRVSGECCMPLKNSETLLSQLPRDPHCAPAQTGDGRL